MADFISPAVAAAAQSTRTPEDVLRARTPSTIAEARATVAKPCPFCGHDIGLPTSMRVGGGYMVSCENDDCFVAPCTSGKTPEEAMDRWNTRSPLPLQAQR